MKWFVCIVQCNYQIKWHGHSLPESTTPTKIITTIQLSKRPVRQELLDFPLIEEACGTPPPFVLAAFTVPDGARLDDATRTSNQIINQHTACKVHILGKLPPLAEAIAMADFKSLAASVGTVDRRPMRGGSCDG